MSEVLIYKYHELDMNISAVRKANVVTNTTFFSYDQRTGKKIINIKLNDAPLDLTGAEVILGFDYVEHDASKIYTSDDDCLTIEDPVAGRCTIILPNDLYEYWGEVLVHVFVRLPDGRSFDAGVIVTKFLESWLDRDLEELQQFYVQRFEDLRANILARAQELADRISDLEADVSQLVGPPGPQGTQGERGERGERGEQGIQGIQGIQGPPGNDGEDGAGLSVLGSLASESDLPTTGNPGDGYIVSGDLFVWVASLGNWLNVGRIQGPQGEQGIQGIQGERGLQGERGERGERGEQGIQGERGEQGIQGERGEQGLQGERGEQGIQGERGFIGAQGPPGPQITVTNNLTSHSADAALSANQGRILNDSINATNANLENRLSGAIQVIPASGTASVSAPANQTTATNSATIAATGLYLVTTFANVPNIAGTTGILVLFFRRNNTSFRTFATPIAGLGAQQVMGTRFQTFNAGDTIDQAVMQTTAATQTIAGLSMQIVRVR